MQFLLKKCKKIQEKIMFGAGINFAPQRPAYEHDNNGALYPTLYPSKRKLRHLKAN